MSVAGFTNCPSCAASVDSDAGACPFCNSSIAIAPPTDGSTRMKFAILVVAVLCGIAAQCLVKGLMTQG